MQNETISLFTMFGPVMIGPSSSHTAGVAKIAFLTRKIFMEDIKKAEIIFYGSLAATYKGHGSDKALIAGLLGIGWDDERLAFSLELAEKAKLEYTIEAIVKKPEKYHPNSVRINLESENNKKLSVLAASIGGGAISIKEISGYFTDLTGDFEALLVLHHDEPGVIAIVSHILSANRVNIASAVSHRKDKGTEAMLIIEVDDAVKTSILEQIKSLPQVYDVVYVPSLLS